MTSDVLKAITAAIKPMQNNRLGNYIVPGLTSSLIGGGTHGKVRLFEAERHTRDTITPHSHRFDFTCVVLTGSVINTLYVANLCGAEEWCISNIGQVCGVNGLEDYVHRRSTEPTLWRREPRRYRAGDTYSMTYEEIHSIEFERGTQVLFFEGPPKIGGSTMLEPWVNGRVVPTFKTEDWMFEREQPSVSAREGL